MHYSLLQESECDIFVCALQDLQQNLEKELDFNMEAKNSKKCAEGLSELLFIHVPQVLSDLSTKVL